MNYYTYELCDSLLTREIEKYYSVDSFTEKYKYDSIQELKKNIKKDMKEIKRTIRRLLNMKRISKKYETHVNLIYVAHGQQRIHEEFYISINDLKFKTDHKIINDIL